MDGLHRFEDRDVLGLGAEIGISASAVPARGPIGLRELTAQRFLVVGGGQVR